MEYDHYKDNGLAAFIQPTDNIVMLGCGSAAFSADMYDDGFVHIKNIDLSSVVIDKMRAMHAVDRPEMTWQVMDVQKLEFDDETFDVAFDKSTMDCLFCCDGSNEIIAEMMWEAWRVLKPGGTLAFSTWPPEHYVGQMFALVGKFVPPPPGAAARLLSMHLRARLRPQR